MSPFLATGRASCSAVGIGFDGILMKIRSDGAVEMVLMPIIGEDEVRATPEDRLEVGHVQRAGSLPDAVGSER